MSEAKKIYAELIQQDRSIKTDISPRQQRRSPDLTLLFSLTFLTAVVTILIANSLTQQKLEDHPMCGVTTGGKVGSMIIIKIRNITSTMISWFVQVTVYKVIA